MVVRTTGDILFQGQKVKSQGHWPLNAVTENHPYLWNGKALSHHLQGGGHIVAAALQAAQLVIYGNFSSQLQRVWNCCHHFIVSIIIAADDVGRRRRCCDDFVMVCVDGPQVKSRMSCFFDSRDMYVRGYVSTIKR